MIREWVATETPTAIQCAVDELLKDYDRVRSEDYAGYALRSLIEECCAGAVVTELPLLEGCPASADCETCPRVDGRMLCDLPIIPIASVGSCAGLALPVAEEMAISAPCSHCSGGCIECDDTGRTGHAPSFAAAYSDANGTRTYHLASVAGPVCGGAWGAVQNCRDCSGTGVRVDVDEISKRYGG